MKTSEIREKTTDELVQLETELGQKLWRSRFDNLSNQLDDTSRLGTLRRDIARVKTILTERSKKASE